MRIIGALALASALAGCSALQLGYANAPQLAYWWLDGYFDFSDAQTPRVREALEQVHQWHRTEELPRLVALARQAEQLAAGDFGGAQACALYESGLARLDALRAQVEPVLAQFALTLTPDQLRHLARRFETNNEDFRKQWVTASAADRRERRLKLFAERLEMAYGKLEEPQRVVLRQQLEASPFDAARVLAERHRRQADTLQVLRQLQAPGTSPAEARRQLQALLARAQHSPDPAYRRLQEQATQHNCALVAAVHAAATPAQREASMRRLRAWQRDFSDLASPK
ncbi:DUF6279 family lipoprotein [Ramlibacter sp. MAHUQ-53]|uniref:DUF6279 family lipoprotein n=1 Tax=unclassified Ramlibacter TaxID=2617605 RepID=UPI003635A8AA